MEDVEKAILISFDQSGSTSAELKQQASTYLQQLKESPNAWQYLLAGFQSSTIAEVRFWFVQALQDLIHSHYSRLDALQVRTALLAWYRQGPALPPYVRNKVAQALAGVAGQEYPEGWPSLVSDVLQPLTVGDDMVGRADMLCRLLRALDDDVISIDVPRNQEESKRSMRVKDALRDGPINDLVDACHHMVLTHCVTSPHVAADVLDALQRYINWMDVGLLVNDTWLPLLFDCVQQGGAASELRGAAVDVVGEIVSKRMEAVQKLQLVQQLPMQKLCSAWYAAPPDDEELCTRIARAIATICTETLEASKRVENSVVGIAAVGLDVDPEAAQEAHVLLHVATTTLAALFPVVVDIMHHPDTQVAGSVLPYLLTHVARIRTHQKKRSGALHAEQRAMVHSLLSSVAQSACYPADSVIGAGMPATAAEAACCEEESASVADRRQDMTTLFKNCSKILPVEAVEYVGSLLVVVTAGGGPGGQQQEQLTWQQVEMCITLLYLLGEHMSDNTITAGQLQPLVLRLLAGPIPHTTHRLVALVLLDTLVRYCRLLEVGRVSQLVGVFLGPLGIGHPASSVCSRAYYLFNRVVKALKEDLQPHVHPIICQLQPQLAALAASPPTPPPSTAHRALPVDDRLYGYEAAGQLLAIDTTQPVEQQQHLLAVVLTPLGQRLAGGRPAELQHVYEALTRLCKGFSLLLVTEQRPWMGVMLMTACARCVQAAACVPLHKGVRARLISLLHRLLECVGAGLAPQLAPAMQVLLHAHADAQDLADALSLMSQLVVKLDVQQLGLQDVVVACVARCLQEVLAFDGGEGGGGRNAPPQGTVEAQREARALQRSFYLFLGSVASNGLVQLLAQHRPHDLLNALAAGAARHPDLGVRKACLAVLQQLVSIDGLQEFVAAAVVGCCSGQQDLDAKDAAVVGYLAEVAMALLSVRGVVGQEALVARLQGVEPGGGPLAEALVVEAPDVKGVRDVLRRVLVGGHGG